MLLVMTPWRNLEASGPDTEIRRRDVSLVRPERRSVCVETVPENGRRCCCCRRCTDRQPRQTNGVVAVRALRWRKAAEAGPATAIDLVAGCMVGAVVQWCPSSALWEVGDQSNAVGDWGWDVGNDGSQGQGRNDPVDEMKVVSSDVVVHTDRVKAQSPFFSRRPAGGHSSIASMPH